MDRQSFIKLTAVTGTSAALTSCGNPEHQVIRFLPDEEMLPGLAVWKPSVCPLCASGCGLTVRVMDADVETTRKGADGAMQTGVVHMPVAKKLDGNPAHPVSQGRICARGQAAIQVTYHPDRITVPLKRSGNRGEGTFQEITWDQALTELIAELDKLAAAGDARALAFLTARRGDPRAALMGEFAAKFGAPAPVACEAFSDDVLRRANGLSFGYEQLPTYDFARSRYVLNFGADVLGTWNSPVAHAAAYGEMRQGRPGMRGAFIQFEPRMTLTGASADEWVAVKPGTEGVVALAIAHVILEHKLGRADGASRAGALLAGWSSGLEEHSPEATEKITGVPAHKLERIAHEFAEHGPSMAIVGGAPLAHTNGLFTAVAVNALNALAGTVGQPGGIFFTPQIGSQSTVSTGESRPSIDKLAASILSAGTPPVKVVLLDGANPVFSTPRAWKVREALDKVPFIASFGSFLDETSALADLILPDHSFLEGWAAAMPESGSLVAVASVAPPVMKPLYQTRAMGDVLLEVSRRLSKKLDLPWEKYNEMLQASFAKLPKSGEDDAWAVAQKQGGWWGELPGGSGGPGGPRAAASGQKPMAYAEPQFDGDAGQYPFHFLPYASMTFLDGSVAHLPWLQEMPDPLTSAMWSSWVEIGSAAAERLGIRDLDIVEIKSQHGSIQSAAFVSPALDPSVIAMPVGQGHQMFTRYASGRGENPLSILAPIAEPETGTLAWAATRVQVTRVGDPDGRLLLYSREKREKPWEYEREK